MPTGKKISAYISEEHFKNLEVLASAKGLQTPAPLIKQVVENFINNEIKLAIQNKASEQALDNAFELMDDRELNGTTLPIAPPVAEIIKKIEHPCRFLVAGAPPNFTNAGVVGRCSRQGMKPCFYPAQAAFNCQLFVTKIAGIKRR